MKKILFAIAIMFVMTFGANAQGGKTDNFFGWEENSVRTEDWSIVFPAMYNSTTDQNGSPLGSGLLVLTALGAGYAVSRKRK